jgi:hypothetical protein
MTTVFTLCSGNYLAHAKTLGDSVIEYNPEYRFVIGLVDRLPKDLAPNFWEPHEIVPIEELNIPGFDEMVSKYNIVELNTAVKPFFIEYLYRRDSGIEAVIYLDPDILVLGSFMLLREQLQQYKIILTPHFCSFDDTPANLHFENTALTVGIYNLGFIGTSRGDVTFRFLDWWKKRVRHACYYQPGSGVFVDQLWINLAPVYFSNVWINKDPGYNMCYWNHFERRLTRSGGKYVVNEKHDLVFYHFSGYNPLKPEMASSRGRVYAFSLTNRPDLKPIYDDYRERLLSNGYLALQKLLYSFPAQRRRLLDVTKQIVRCGARRLFDALPPMAQKSFRLWRYSQSFHLRREQNR